MARQRLRFEGVAFDLLVPTVGARELADVGHAWSESRFAQDGRKFLCDRDGLVFVVLGGERQAALLGVVIVWREACGGARPDSQVGTQQQPAPQIFGRVGEERSAFFRRCRDIARARAWGFEDAR